MTDFRNIAIVGVGLIGGSLGLSLKRFMSDLSIVGISQRDTISKALSMGVIDKGFSYEEMSTALKLADLVFLCTPILKILDLLPEVAQYVKPGAVVTDVGSTKGVIVSKALKVFSPDVRFIGGHPMTGSEKRGVTAADPFLFQNAIYVLTPTEGTPASVSEALGSLLSKIGAQVIVMEPRVHDEVAAAISHLPQMIAISLVNMVGSLNKSNPFFLRLAAGGFRDMTRIASSPYQVWQDICLTNNKNIISMIDHFISYLGKLKEIIDNEELAAWFDFASKTRATIPKDSKGFLRPLADILVVVEDKPGVIATISLVLAETGINISDIEVLKVREHEGGTLRLAFENRSVAQTALEILQSLGYEARER